MLKSKLIFALKMSDNGYDKNTCKCDVCAKHLVCIYFIEKETVRIN